MSWLLGAYTCNEIVMERCEKELVLSALVDRVGDRQNVMLILSMSRFQLSSEMLRMDSSNGAVILDEMNGNNHNSLSNEPTNAGMLPIGRPFCFQLPINKVRHYQMKVTFINNKETAEVDISKCTTVVF